MKIFQNEEFGQVRTVTINDEPWFVGKDVATALGYSNTKDALTSHVSEEDRRILLRSEIATLENFVSGDVPNRGLTIINESGLYALIFGSKLETSKRFKHWVTSEVLPTIRKTGSYGVKKPTRPLTTDDYIEAAKIISKCTPLKLQLTLGFLENGGFDIPKLQCIQLDQQGKEYVVPTSVNDFTESLNSNDVIGACSADVYDDYSDFCEAVCMEAVSKIMFSKYINRMFHTRTQPRNINGSTRRVFVVEERGDRR